MPKSKYLGLGLGDSVVPVYENTNLAEETIPELSLHSEDFDPEQAYEISPAPESGDNISATLIEVLTPLMEELTGYQKLHYQELGLG